MFATKEELIKKYSEAIKEGNAAIFAGAGLSIASGYIDWKELLRPFASQLGLDIEKENDYLAIAQYYRNERFGRASVNETILSAFSKEAKENPNIDIITRLPISTYWTTNYDHLIENGLEKSNRLADVKIEVDQLSCSKHDRDAVVYKMHGDVERPSRAVLTKDDYVLYDRSRKLFKTVLKGDLISKTFLFIGFSFEDPNLDYVLNQIHALLDENTHEHYCFFRRVKKDGLSDKDYGYAQARQELKAKDLARYGIQTVFIDEYSEITETLMAIETAVKHNNVFISGSAAEYGAWNKDDAERLTYEVARSLVRDDFKITSGFGFGIGSTVVNGALDEIYRSKYKHADEHLCLRPFPQGIKDDGERKRLYTKYRKDMIAETGVSVFLFGNKNVSKDLAKKDIVDADGCLEEFQISKENGNVIIPIGATGYVAKKILDEIKSDINMYPYLEGYTDILEKATDISKIVETVLEIIRKNSQI